MFLEKNIWTERQSLYYLIFPSICSIELNLQRWRKSFDWKNIITVTIEYDPIALSKKLFYYNSIKYYTFTPISTAEPPSLIKSIHDLRGTKNF